MKSRAATIAAITLTAVLTLAGCTYITGGRGSDDMLGMGPSSGSVAEDVNTADLRFTMMMIPHHEQAVEMADLVIAADGIDPRVVRLAGQIKTDQSAEIELMESWLDEWDLPMGDMGDMGDMGHGGMMSDTDMRALEDATGVEASRLFLEEMIDHHRGGIEMAEDEVDDGRNRDVVALAERIIVSQTAEIATMEDILASL